MTFWRGKKEEDSELETVAAAIVRLEAITDRIQATAAVLEQLVIKLREEEAEEARQ